MCLWYVGGWLCQYVLCVYACVHVCNVFAQPQYQNESGYYASNLKYCVDAEQRVQRDSDKNRFQRRWSVHDHRGNQVPAFQVSNYSFPSQCQNLHPFEETEQ